MDWKNSFNIGYVFLAVALLFLLQDMRDPRHTETIAYSEFKQRLSFIASAFYARWFISVWCFFAAALSAIVLLYFLKRDPSREPRHGMAV